jgi:hypothetical protein
VELDFVLVSSGIEITSFRIPEITLSDHRPLVCDFHVQLDQYSAAQDAAQRAAGGAALVSSAATAAQAAPTTDGG